MWDVFIIVDSLRISKAITKNIVMDGLNAFKRRNRLDLLQNQKTYNEFAKIF